MLTLNDGRSELWQWDTGRKLTVDADCSQVHFSNKVFGRSIDVDVMDGLAIIPDILLQTDKELTAWAFVGTAENGYTKISKTFNVNRRNMPADYVFTPPDQTSLEEIKERLENLESIQDPDAIKNAVEDYLEQNPVEAPVKSVNGKTGTVKLTADDVGAISQDDLQEATNEALAQAKASGEFDGQQGQKGDKGEPGPAGPAGADGQPGEPGVDGKTPIKGTDYFTEADKQEIAEAAAGLVKVPEATMKPLTFTGAVKATYDGSEAVSVEIPTGGGGSGGGSANWNLLRSVTLAEDTKYITQSLDGNYDEIRILFNNLWCVEGKSAQLAIAVNNGNTGISTMCAVGGSFVNAPAYPSEGAILISKMSDSISSCTIIGQNTSGNKNGCGTFALVNNVADGISKVMFSLNVYGQNTMNAGAVIDIYGR